MIKVEAIFDGEKITVNGKEFTVRAEYGYDTVMCFENKDEGEYITIEEAVNYCLNDHASNP